MVGFGPHAVCWLLHGGVAKKQDTPRGTLYQFYDMGRKQWPAGAVYSSRERIGPFCVAAARIMSGQ